MPEKEKVLLIIEDCHTQLLKVALEKHGVSRASFFRALEKYPETRDGYLRAQVARAEQYVEEALYISDNEEDAQKARNQIEIRKWIASKTIPSKYGDRIDISIQGQVDIKGALEEAKTRVRDILSIAENVTVENETQKQIEYSGSKPEEPTKEGPETESAVLNSLDDLLE